MRLEPGWWETGGGQRQQLRLSRLESGSVGRECPSLGLWASLGLGGGWVEPTQRSWGGDSGSLYTPTLHFEGLVRAQGQNS